MPTKRNRRHTNVRYDTANREREIARVRARQDRTTAFLRELREVPCADCGGRFAQCAMDFDQRDPSTKFRGVTGIINGSTDRMLAAAAKCDIVCANCHRLRTFERRSRQLA